MTSRLPYPLDHATHLPFLIGLGATFPVRRVLEFGSGIFSTLLFLNRKAFPKLEALITVEPEQTWRDKIKALAGDDNRLTILEEDPPLFAVDYADLVFVDNGPEQHKIETIENMARESNYAIVVVHDAEHDPYALKISEFRTQFISSSYNPGTAICTNANYGEVLGTNYFKIENTVRSNIGAVRVDDVEAWMEIMNG
jgi:hypothetical protein